MRPSPCPSPQAGRVLSRHPDDAERARDAWEDRIQRHDEALDQRDRYAPAPRPVHADVQLRAGRLKLRAERRWGELLGPAENTGVPVTNGDRKAVQRAREVAAVPEPVFDRYLATVKDPDDRGPR